MAGAWQTDVVEAEWSRFQQRMAAVDSLGAAQQAHSLFLDTLTAHAFLDEPAIMSAVAEVLAQCRQLAATVQVCPLPACACTRPDTWSSRPYLIVRMSVRSLMNPLLPPASPNFPSALPVCTPAVTARLHLICALFCLPALHSLPDASAHADMVTLWWQFWGIDGPPHQGAGSQAAAVKGALGSLLEALNQLQGVSRSRAPSLGNLVCNLELCDTCQSL